MLSPTSPAAVASPPADTGSPAPILRVRGLTVSLRSASGLLPVLTDVSFDVAAGESLAIVGESGSGKTATGLAVMGLLPESFVVESGTVTFRGEELLGASRARRNALRGKHIAMVPQEPMTSLDPAFSVGTQIAEVVCRHERVNRRIAWSRAVEMLSLVGIPAPARRARQYPHEFSGGMRQRVLIAMSLSCGPSLLIADEPTTALDVTSQAQVLDLLETLAADMNMATVITTHDLGVVAEFSHRIAVMYAGQIVEEGTTRQVFTDPHHPYTAGLMKCGVVKDGRASFEAIPGTPPALGAFGTGCRFYPRCEHALAGRCDVEAIQLLPLPQERRARCVLAEVGALTRSVDHD